MDSVVFFAHWAQLSATWCLQTDRRSASSLSRHLGGYSKRRSDRIQLLKHECQELRQQRQSLHSGSVVYFRVGTSEGAESVPCFRRDAGPGAPEQAAAQSPEGTPSVRL